MTSAAEPYFAFFAERYADSYRVELDAFFSAVQAGEPVEVNFDDGCKALRLAEAASLSMREGRAVDVGEIV